MAEECSSISIGDY